MSTTDALRIGEFSRRVGVSPELLRAWERRYGVLQPVRSDGGFRLYTTEDAERIARMKLALDEGLSAAEAARRALTTQPRSSDGTLDDARTRLVAATHAYDEPGVHEILDRAFARFSLETALQELIVPALQEIGAEWSRGEIEIGQEHFATNVIRERLLALGRHWGRGGGPLALLACPSGERHDIGLIAFGLVLRSHGWRILFVGADTPMTTLIRASETTAPQLIVVSSMDTDLLEAERNGLRKLAGSTRLVLAGAGASDELCRRLKVERLDGDLVAAAEAIGSGS